jgi:hypothetical protein
MSAEGQFEQMMQAEDPRTSYASWKVRRGDAARLLRMSFDTFNRHVRPETSLERYVGPQIKVVRLEGVNYVPNAQVERRGRRESGGIADLFRSEHSRRAKGGLPEERSDVSGDRD